MASAAAILREGESNIRKIPTGTWAGPAVWDKTSLRAEEGVVHLDRPALKELDSVVATLRENPLATECLQPADFELDACRRLMSQVKQILDQGVGFVIIDRLPLDTYSRDQATAVYWILSQLVSRPVAQNWRGRLIYDVRDFGKPPGNGVRPDVTNAEQNFHTDNSYNICPPDYVSLLCLRPAMEGGVSSIVSFQSVYNEMARKAPRHIERLFSPYLFDRNREHGPDSPPVIAHPLMHLYDGSLACRLSHVHVVNGYKMAGIELDAESEDALETLEEVMRQPHLSRDFFFEPGQIQIVDNRRLGHRRTGFVDHPEEDRKRHLIRLWLRDHGRRFYNG